MKNKNLYKDLSEEDCQQINGGCFAHDAGTALKLLWYSQTPGGVNMVMSEYYAESAAGEYDH